MYCQLPILIYLLKLFGLLRKLQERADELLKRVGELPERAGELPERAGRFSDLSVTIFYEIMYFYVGG